MEQVSEVIVMDDWAEEFYREEPNMRSFDDAVNEQMKHGYSPQQIGRWAVVGRVLGETEPKLVPPTKCLVQSGATSAFVRRLQQEKKDVETEDGKEIRVRKYVGPVLNEDEEGGDEDYKWVQYDDEKAVERAQHYLINAVPGHIRSRLNIIAANNGNVREAAEKLVNEIYKMVSVLE